MCIRDREMKEDRLKREEELQKWIKEMKEDRLKRKEEHQKWIKEIRGDRLKKEELRKEKTEEKKMIANQNQKNYQMIKRRD